MSKLSVGVYCPKWKAYYWFTGPSETCPARDAKQLTTKQYYRYLELYDNEDDEEEIY